MDEETKVTDKNALMTSDETMIFMKMVILKANKVEDPDTDLTLEHVNVFSQKFGLPKSSCWGILSGYVKPTNAILLALNLESVTMYKSRDI